MTGIAAGRGSVDRAELAKRGMLVLEDGTTVTGLSYGAEGQFVGEVVFNTAMSGYQEVITDPSYWGQMVVFTCPHIGNVGINLDDVEGGLTPEGHPAVRAIIARKISSHPSNWRSARDAQGRYVSISQYASTHGIPVLSGVDTRLLTRTLREKGVMKAALATGLSDDDLDGLGVRLLELAQAAPDMSQLSPASEVTCPEEAIWESKLDSVWLDGIGDEARWLLDSAPGTRVTVIDCGTKRNILRLLDNMGCRVTQVPATSSCAQVLATDPDRVLITNGPGDPVNWADTIELVRELIGLPANRSVPMFGICLGHQLLSLAAGARTFKLPFGHHGCNHPVRDLRTGRIEITSQNHNYGVTPDSLIGLPYDITHTNLYDGTIEGMQHRELPISSVQYHPEASPGPHDSLHLLSEFVHTGRTGNGT